jgi:hypothetical protein
MGHDCPAELRDMGVRGLLIYCAGHRCSHSITVSGDAWGDWADHVRLSDIEPRLARKAPVSGRTSTGKS